MGLAQADFFTTTAGEVLSRDFSVCAPEDLQVNVLAKMHAHGLVYVLVVDASNKVLGVVNARDGLRVLLAAGIYEEAMLRNYVMGVAYQLAAC